MRAMPSATDSTVPTSVRSALDVSRPSIRLLRMEVISSGLICMKWLLGAAVLVLVLVLRPRDLLAKLIETVADRGVEHEVAYAHDESAEDVGVDLAGELDLLTGLLSDPLSD